MLTTDKKTISAICHCVSIQMHIDLNLIHIYTACTNFEYKFLALRDERKITSTAGSEYVECFRYYFVYTCIYS